MKKLCHVTLFVALTSLFCFGCAPTATSLKGRLLYYGDGPITDAELVAEQVQPVKGDEKVVSKTDLNGAFLFEMMRPKSAYVLLPIPPESDKAPAWMLKYQGDGFVFNRGGWMTDKKLVIETGTGKEKTPPAVSIEILPYTSSLKGVVFGVDGKPVPGVKIFAIQEQPAAGYADFFSVTNSEGVFLFDDMYPQADYSLRLIPPPHENLPIWVLNHEGSDFLFDETGWTTDKKPVIRTGLAEDRKPKEISVAIAPYVTSVSGNVADSNGKPVPGIVVTAKPTTPVKGYEESEAVTDPNGGFHFPALYPDSQYDLLSKDNNFEKRSIKTLAGQQALALDASIVTNRFVVSKEGLITDTHTGLQWMPDPGREMDWTQANAHVKAINAGGHTDWTLPTETQAKTLYDGANQIAHKYKADPIFGISGSCVWLEKSRNASTAYCMMFTTGFVTWDEKKKSYNNHVLAVRSLK